MDGYGFTKAESRYGLREPDNEVDVGDRGYPWYPDRQAMLIRPLELRLPDGLQTKFAQKRLIRAMEHYRWRVGR